MTFLCRSCASPRLAPVIDLGVTPLANGLLGTETLKSPEPRFPLKVVVCEACSLVQLTETVPPEVLFSEYVYFSSFSDTAVAAAKQLATRLTRARALDAASLVIEAASNDGYLLQHYQHLGVPVLGIEPAGNIAAVANERGVATRCAFFGLAEAEKLVSEDLRCDIFHANNVLAHVADLNGFVAGIAAVLKPGGLASIEVPYVRDLVEKIEFDTIYHEHLCYFSATALNSLFRRHGLALIDIERIPIHGGSLRLFASQSGERTPAVDTLLAEEAQLGVTQSGYYAEFSARVGALKRDLVALLARLKGEGRSVAAYGASAKGSTLLNYCGIGRDRLDFVVDRSSVKQGKFTPGTHLPILSPDVLVERRPDYLLLLSWNFADEILQQISAYREAGGKVILPVPEVRIV